ncbi:unnamed protein product [Danaus chrysippus]|uniref:(African queen) hypothetical protein n=1 Tax=Danaus chrysippus TaxID=151541 RepID=A0A8J2QR11_9NEOP|nr:unnamed protein product [Danaus chrysippus]
MFFVLIILNGVHGFKVPGNCGVGHFYEPSLMDCLPCPANASLVTSADVTQNVDGSPMKEVQCVKCARGYKALNNRCVWCEACACKKHEIVVKGNCIPRKYVLDRPKYSENILHPDEVLEFIKLEYLCTKQDYRACRILASVCVRNHNTYHPAGPCRLWIQSNLTSLKGLPLLTTDDFKSNKADLSLSLSMNSIDLILATHTASGGLKIFQNTDKLFQKCLPSMKIKIGASFRIDRDVYSEGALKVQLLVEIQYALKHPSYDTITTSIIVEHQTTDAGVTTNLEATFISSLHSFCSEAGTLSVTLPLSEDEEHLIRSMTYTVLTMKALDSLSWVASERTVLERLLDIELTDREGGNTSILLYDDNVSIPSLLSTTWMGEECSLATFDAMVFGCILIASEQYLLAALLTAIVWKENVDVKKDHSDVSGQEIDESHILRPINLKITLPPRPETYGPLFNFLIKVCDVILEDFSNSRIPNYMEIIAKSLKGFGSGFLMKMMIRRFAKGLHILSAYHVNLDIGIPLSISGLTNVKNPNEPLLLLSFMEKKSNVRSEGIFENFIRSLLDLLTTTFPEKRLSKFCRTLYKYISKIENKYARRFARHIRYISKMYREDLKNEFRLYREEFSKPKEHKTDFIKAMDATFTLKEHILFQDYISDLKDYGTDDKLFIDNETDKVINYVIMDRIWKSSARDRDYLEKMLRLAIDEYRRDHDTRK